MTSARARKLWLAAVFALGAASRAHAEDPRDVPAIGLDEVLRRAQRDPPAVLVAYARYREAQAAHGAAGSAWLPAVRAQASAGYAYDNRIVLPNVPRIDSESIDTRGDVTLEWTALDAARGERIDAAEAHERARGHDVDAVRAQAMVSAAELYVRAGASIEFTKDAELSLERRRDQFDATTQLVNAGTRSPVDVQRAKIEVLSAEYVASMRRTDELAAYSALATAIGQSADDLVRPATTSVEFPVTATSAERARQLAAANRPELRSAAATLTAVRREYDAAIGERWPTLGALANGTISYVDVRRGVGIGGNQYAGLASIVLRWDGLDPAVWTQAGVVEEAIGVADRDRAELAHALEAEAVSAFYALERARLEHQRAVAVLEAAQVTREAQNGRYLAGLGSLLELLDAEDIEQQARQQRIAARRDEAIASAQLQAACGLRLR